MTCRQIVPKLRTFTQAECNGQSAAALRDRIDHLLDLQTRDEWPRTFAAKVRNEIDKAERALWGAQRGW